MAFDRFGIEDCGPHYCLHALEVDGLKTEPSAETPKFVAELVLREGQATTMKEATHLCAALMNAKMPSVRPN